MLKALCIAGVVAVLVVGQTAIALAVPIESVPNPRRQNGTWVSDMANLLDANTEARLNQMIRQLEAQNGSEIAVVTVPNVAPMASPKSFATTLFNYWGIGKQGRNNGVLFLISKGDRRTEIETGRGLSSKLPNQRVQQILQQQVTPRFKQGQFNQGTLAGTQALVSELQRLGGSPRAAQTRQPARSPAIAQTAPTSRPAAPPTKPQPTVSLVPVVSPGMPGLAPTDSGNNALVSLLIGSGVGLAAAGGVALYRRSRRLLLTPEGDSRTAGGDRDQERIHCEVCKTAMTSVHDFELEPYLTPAQQVAQKIGSQAYQGWRCAKCQISLYGRGFHLRTYELEPDRFSPCETCQERTAKRQVKETTAPTWNREGQLTIANDCQCCGKQWQTTEAIPCLELPDDGVLLLPMGESRVHNGRLFQSAESARPTHCVTCHYPMQDVSARVLGDRLSKAEQTAYRLGSVNYIAWQCPHCVPQSTPDLVHIRAYVLASRYKYCPHCEELTLEETSRTVRSATTTHDGQREIVTHCHCCTYRENHWETIPRLVNEATARSSSSFASHSRASDHSNSVFFSSSSDAASSSSDYSSSSSDYSSSSSSDYSSSSSSDFGGGSSDGGGAGDSW